MGHRSFLGKRIRPQVLKPSENYDRSPHPNARNYAEEMAPVNGNVQLSESQNELARKKREEFTNEVSRRMGDLLLRSWTMLDCYCTRCNGILMEKGETRECIQCTVFAEMQQVEPGSAQATAELEDRVQKEDETFDQPRMKNSSKKVTSEIRELKSKLVKNGQPAPAAVEAPVRIDNIPPELFQQSQTMANVQAAQVLNAFHAFSDREHRMPEYVSYPHHIHPALANRLQQPNHTILDPNSQLSFCSQNSVPRSQQSTYAMPTLPYMYNTDIPTALSAVGITHQMEATKPNQVGERGIAQKPIPAGEAMSLSALDRKLVWAAKSLDETDDIGKSIELTKFITEALTCIKQFRR